MIEYTVKCYDSGHTEWWLNDKRHREDGPAVEFCDGCKHWYLDNKLHREDGPAIERPRRYPEWYLNGIKMTETQFLTILSRKRCNKDLKIDINKAILFLKKNNDTIPTEVLDFMKDACIREIDKR